MKMVLKEHQQSIIQLKIKNRVTCCLIMDRYPASKYTLTYSECRVNCSPTKTCTPNHKSSTNPAPHQSHRISQRLLLMRLL